MKYTAEEVREAAATNEHPIPLRVRDMLTTYADSLERAQGGVTDGVVDVAHDTIFGHPSFDIGENGFLGKPAVRAALLAVWPNPPAQAAQVDANAALVEAMKLPDGYEVVEHLPGIWGYEYDRDDGERMASSASWNHPALAAIGAWRDHVEALAESAEPAAQVYRCPRCATSMQVDSAAKPYTLADFVHASDAERVQIGQQVAARVDEMMAEPVAQAAQSEDWRIAFFERWHEAAQEKGYVGIAAAITAVPAAELVAQDDWRIGFFERWREAAHEKGYAGIAEAITAAPTAPSPGESA